ASCSVWRSPSPWPATGPACRRSRRAMARRWPPPTMPAPSGCWRAATWPAPASTGSRRRWPAWTTSRRSSRPTAPPWRSPTGAPDQAGEVRFTPARPPALIAADPFPPAGGSMAAPNFDPETILAGLREWVEIESPTYTPAAVNRCMDAAQAALEAIGGSTERIPGRDGIGDIMKVRLPGEANGPGILLLGHLDTVHEIGALAGPLRFRREGDRVY